MKTIARILLFSMILSLIFSLSGCYLYIGRAWQARNEKFAVAIVGVDQKETIDFEITKSYRIEIKFFGDVTVTRNTYNNVKIEYNEENAEVSYSYYQARNKMVHFTIHLSEFGTNDTLKFTYAGETIEVPYNVIDYDFEENGWVTPTSIDDLDEYPEFKEMLLSIKYHEFEEPYGGLGDYTDNFYWSSDYWSYDLSDKNDVGYLKYLTDSVYYPSTFDLVLQNPIASREAYMSFENRETVMEGAGRSTIKYFCVGYGVIDPGCTNPQYPLYSMGFVARDKSIYSNNKNITSLLELYPERFFVYNLNGVDIYVWVVKDSGPQAYFTDEHYIYNLSASYEK